jgi:hypothetical protein
MKSSPPRGVLGVMGGGLTCILATLSFEAFRRLWPARTLVKKVRLED